VFEKFISYYNNVDIMVALFMKRKAFSALCGEWRILLMKLLLKFDSWNEAEVTPSMGIRNISVKKN
jgi:hypothetical protein